MSNIESITYEELMRECNIGNAIEFRRLLRNRQNLPQVSQHKAVPRKDAEMIVKALLGRGIDWLKYKSKDRDEKDEGLLDWSDSSEIFNTVNNWCLEIDLKDATERKGSQLVALACDGGFLAGRDKPAFVVGFDKGINVIIGDRGSGKSTVLSLLGAVSDSVGEETQVLVRQLLNILHPDNKNSENEKANFNRRIFKMLRHYSIEEYGIFFSIDGFLYCYYINKKLRTYSLLNYFKNSWQFEPLQNIYLQIPLLSLSQGEVIRIAEDRGQNYYLNNLLDAIYPDLFEKRTKLFQSAQSLLRRSNIYKPSFFLVNTGRILQFLQMRLAELNKMQRELERGEFSIGSEKLIYSFLDRCEDYLFHHPEKVWDKTRIIDYFQDTDEDVLYYLYVTRIKKFLFKKLSEIIKLRRTPNSSGEIPPGLVTDQPEEQDKNMVSESIVEENDISESQAIFGDDDEDTPPALDDDLEEIDIRDEADGSTNEEKEDLAVFLKSIGAEERVWESRALLNAAREVVDFLRNRLLVLSNWRKIYAYRRERYDDDLKSLTKDYINLLDQKSQLVRDQSKKCEMITSVLNKDNFAINITTAQVEQTINEVRVISQKINALERRYYQIQHATPSTNLPELRAMQSEYDNTLISVKNQIELLDEQINQNKIDYFTFPIRIELLQGNTFREFQQLSFGQKSGIILKMVLSTTTKSIIVIDQPEDNLDAFSIINIIAPALKNLRTQHDRQIIVVTHNSNLVMETSPDRLIALESRGDSGRIKFLGPPVGKQAVREIFDILEGGVPTFAQKIKTYENFVGMAKKVEDWDIHLIESSFRQRTIDELRNYLQPIVTDSSMLDFLRHQLKQWDPKEFRQHIREFINRLEKMEETPEKSHDGLFLMLTGLAEELDYHIQQFMISINEIRMMDTQPKPEIVDLYAVLKNREADIYIERIKQSRKIKIEVNPDIQGISVFADPNHLELVFKNMIENSLRATEKVATRNRRNKDEYVETVSIALDDQNDKHVRISYSDNGCGVSEEILRRLYIEPCSTKEGKEGHGLGGIIIRKLLEINNGSIDVMESRTLPSSSGLVQRILLTKPSSKEGMI